MKNIYEVWYIGVNTSIEEMQDFNIGDTFDAYDKTCELVASFDTYEEAVKAMDSRYDCMNEIYIYSDNVYVTIYETYLIEVPQDKHDDYCWSDWITDYRTKKIFVNGENYLTKVFYNLEDAKKYVQLYA